MGEIEAEVLLLGIWKNVADLEESLSLPELEAILKASRDREHRQNTFAAALKGIDLNEGASNDAKERFDEVQRRVEAKLTGKEKSQLDLDVFAFDFEKEE